MSVQLLEDEVEKTDDTHEAECYRVKSDGRSTGAGAGVAGRSSCSLAIARFTGRRDCASGVGAGAVREAYKKWEKS
jgi:hypothetical protein